jgi:hypothetical protein
MPKAHASVQEKKLKKEERVELFEKLAWVDGPFASISLTDPSLK